MKKIIAVVFSSVITIACSAVSNENTNAQANQSLPVKYYGDKKSFDDFKNQYSKDWPTPDTIDYYDPEGKDGSIIRYAHWTPKTRNKTGVVVHFNGRTEFIEKNIYTYKDLLERGFEIWTFDWRGQGFSKREIDQKQKHEIKDFQKYVDDASYFINNIAHIKQAQGKKVLLAHSMGGQIALRYLLDKNNQNAFDYLVLSSPLLRVKNDSRRIRILNKEKIRIGLGNRCVGTEIPEFRNLKLYYSPEWQSYFKEGDSCNIMGSAKIDYNSTINPETNPKNYSNDLNKLAEIDCLVESSKDTKGSNEPDLRLACPTSDWLRAAFQSTDIVMSNAKKLSTPTLIVRALPDNVVDNNGQKTFCNLAGKNCTIYDIKVIDGVQTGHELLIEKESIRKVFLNEFDKFVQINLNDKLMR